jgi:hypothetical protein
MDFKYLSAFILKRLDDLVHGLLKSEDEPVLSIEKMKPLLQSMESASLNEEGLLKLIEEQLENTSDENGRVSLEVIKEEIVKEETRPIVIKGMLVNIENEASLRELVEKIREFFQI